MLNELVPDKRVSIVEIVVGNGERYKLRVDYAKGESENPASEEDLNDKFKLLASTILNENNLQEILTRINRIETFESISKILEFLKTCAREC